MVGSGIHYMDHPKDKDHSFAFSLTSSNQMSNTIPTTSNQIKFSHPTFAAFQSPTKKKNLQFFQSHKKYHPFSPWKISSANPRDFLDLFFSPHFAIEKLVTSKVRKIHSKGAEETAAPNSCVGKTPIFQAKNVRNCRETTETRAFFVFFHGIYGFQGLSNKLKTITKKQLTKKLYPIFLHSLFHRDFDNGLFNNQH